MMLFSALVVRTFGTKRTRREDADADALSAHYFFVKFAGLHSFLLTELELAAQQLSGPLPQMDPGLYPCLAILARLCPSSTVALEYPLEPFIPLVTAFATQSPWEKIRRVAARALVPLISNELGPVLQHTERLVDGLISAGHRNELHGRCLMLHEILKRNCHPLTKMESNREVAFGANPLVLVEDMMEEEDMNVLATESSNSELNEALLLLLSSKEATLLEAASETTCDFSRSVLFKIINDFVGNIASFRDVVSTVLGREDLETPGLSLVQASAAILMTRIVLKEKTLDQFGALLESTTYEVQTSCLDTLLLSDVGFSEEEKQQLARPLWRIVETPGYVPRVRSLALRALASLDLFYEQRYWNDVESMIQMPQTALSIRCSALLLTGSFLHLPVIREAWLTMLWTYTEPERPHCLRQAATLAIKTMFRRQKDLESWALTDSFRLVVDIVCFRLLHDDDELIREEACAFVGNFLQLEDTLSNYRTTELLMEYVVRQFGKQQDGFELASLLMGRLALEPVLYLSKDNAILFQKENPNTYKEILLDYRYALQALTLLRQQRSFSSMEKANLRNLVKQQEAAVSSVSRAWNTPEVFLRSNLARCRQDASQLWAE